MKNIIFFTMVCLLVACFGRQPEKTGLEGKMMPEFSLLLPDSSTWLNTASIPAGKPSALFIFNPYCPYCKAQMKEIIEDMPKLKDIHFYAITAFPFREMKKFYDEFHLEKYPNITAAVDTARFAANYFEILGVPYMAIYDKDKKLSKAFVGQVYSRQIVSAANGE